MLSGIGPKEELDKLDIQIIKDLKVGSNLQDHAVHLQQMIFNDSIPVKPEK